MRSRVASAVIMSSRRRLAILVAVLLATTGVRPSAAGIIGQWDFSQGWNNAHGSVSGVISPVSGVPQLSLVHLAQTSYYTTFGGSPPKPQLDFQTTSAFGIANLGTDGSTVVMKLPDARDKGGATGLLAQFPLRTNGAPGSTALNRYSLVMDVLVPETTFRTAEELQGTTQYLALFQSNPSQDAAWFVRNTGATTTLGVAASYGGPFAHGAWQRLALVMALDEPTSSARYRAYIDGQEVSSLVWDSIATDSTRNIALRNVDLVNDGNFAIGTLARAFPSLFQTSTSESVFTLFNDGTNELGELYVANLQFRDDALSPTEIAALGGPAPGVVPVPEPATLGLLGAAGLAAGCRLTRRRLLAGLGAVGSAAFTAGRDSLLAAEAPTATLPKAKPAGSALADYVQSADGSTDWKRIAGGDFGAGRFLAAELQSQTWRGNVWRHQFAVYLPERLAAERPPLVLWIDGGSTPEGQVQPPAKQLPIVAAIGDAAGLPVAVVRQVPNQPLEGGRREDDLIAHTFEQFFESGDPASLLLLPMVKTVASALDAAADLVQREWQIDLDGCVVAGASKRGWTSWLAAAVEPRVKGLVPMVIDMLDLPRHMRLQIESFGAPSEALHDYVSRGLHRRLDTPRGHELLAIVDPVRHAAAITQPKIIALGTNDEYWPLESLDLYRGRLRGPTWVSYAPNSGHDIPSLRVAPLVAALGRHVAGVEPLPDVAWTCDPASRTCSLAADPLPAETLLWTAASDTRDFRGAKWASQRVELTDGRCREPLEPPATGFRAAVVECRYARAPLPVYLSSGPLMVGSV